MVAIAHRLGFMLKIADFSESPQMLNGYRAFILLPAHNAPSIERVKHELQQVFDRVEAPTRIEITDPNCLTLSIADWQIRIYTNGDPSVLVEAQEIAAAHLEPDDPRQATLPTYDFRIEIGCDPDPRMERFNYYVYVLETLNNFPGAIVFDPTTTGFIE